LGPAVSTVAISGCDTTMREIVPEIFKGADLPAAT
jgi:hypothetical protein